MLIGQIRLRQLGVRSRPIKPNFYSMKSVGGTRTVKMQKAQVLFVLELVNIAVMVNLKPLSIKFPQ